MASTAIASGPIVLGFLKQHKTKGAEKHAILPQTQINPNP
jgi:hypothetical protein